MRRHKEHAAEVASVHHDVSLPAVGLTGELTAILASCNDRLLDLQKQAMEIACSEAGAIQAAWLNAVMAIAQMAPRESDRNNTTRLVEIVNGWFQVVAQTQTALIELIGKSAAGGAQAAAGLARQQPPIASERRRLAVVIDFPDRRRAA